MTTINYVNRQGLVVDVNELYPKNHMEKLYNEYLMSKNNGGK